MSVSERRRNYSASRILIDSERILNPQFDPVTLTLDGAQVEMLRNVVQYLTSQATYIADRQLGYYLMPTVEDYDTIIAVVADLQDKLMGGSGAMYEYKDRYAEDLSDTMSADDDYEGISTPVPEDEILILEQAYVVNRTGNREDTTLAVINGADWYFLAASPGLLKDDMLIWQGRLTLKEGDTIVISMEDCLDGDEIGAGIWGYTIDVS